MTLARGIQDDFSVGVQLDTAPHLVDPRSMGGCLNGLLADDGSVFLRGGSQAIGAAAAAIHGIWDGWLIPGHRTVLQTASGFRVQDGGSFPLLGGSNTTIPRPARMVEGLLFLPPGWIYGGSLKSAAANTGTVLLTKGQKVIRGVGTSWLTTVDEGMLFRRPNERAYVITSVNSNTELAINVPYEGATAFDPAPLFELSPLLEVGTPYRETRIYGQIAGRLLVVEDHNKVRHSERDKPHSYVETDFHELDGGVEVLGLEALDTDLFVFTTQGYWLFRNMALNLTDASGNLQQKESQLSRTIVLWGGAGVCGYAGALVVPALDALYLCDAVSQPVPISKPINKRYRAHVAAGHAPGQAAIYRDHYLLPIVDASGQPRDFLTVRLDRSVSGRGQTFFPWTWQDPDVSAVTVRAPSRATERPELIAADGVDLHDLTGYFTPQSYFKLDVDGEPPELELRTRKFATGPPGTRNRLRRARLFAELAVDPPDLADAYVELDYTMGKLRGDIARWDEVDWDEFDWEDASDDLLDWVTCMDPDNPATPARMFADDGTGGQDFYVAGIGRYAAFRLRSSGPCARLAIRQFEVFTAVGGRARHTKVPA